MPKRKGYFVSLKDKGEGEHKIEHIIAPIERFFDLPYEAVGQLPADHFHQRFGTTHQKFLQN